MKKSIDFSKIDAELLMIATIKAVSGYAFTLQDVFRRSIHLSLGKNVIIEIYGLMRCMIWRIELRRYFSLKKPRSTVLTAQMQSGQLMGA